jgi:hypothetical protein
MNFAHSQKRSSVPVLKTITMSSTVKESDFEGADLQLFVLGIKFQGQFS